MAGLRSRTSRDRGLMHLLRCLVFVEAHHQCHPVPEYIDTRANHLADDLSRNNASSFLLKVPDTNPCPSPVSLPLLSLLLDRLDVSHFATSVQQYFQEGLAHSTRKSYQAAMRRFYKFCTTYSINTPFPLSEQLLCSYAAFLADQGLTPQTIKSYLSALRNLQLTLGLPDPREKSSMPILKSASWHQEDRFQKGQPPKIRLPITTHLMRRIKHALDTSLNPEKEAVWAVASTAFFGFFRLGELLPDSAKSFDKKMCLSWGDVAVDDRVAPKMIQVHLKRSKCDQFGSGADVVVGITGDELCPIAAILYFIELMGDKKGAFFLTSSGEVISS